jgi:serine/threonine protein kinase
MAPPFNLGGLMVRFVQRLSGFSSSSDTDAELLLASLVQEWSNDGDMDPRCFMLAVSKSKVSGIESALYLKEHSTVDDSGLYLLPEKIVTVSESDPKSNNWTSYILYPYKSPFTLATIYAMPEALDEYISLFFTRQLLDMLMRLHHVQGIVHQEVKLEHILVVQDEEGDGGFSICLGFFEQSLVMNALKADLDKRVEKYQSEDRFSMYAQWMVPFISQDDDAKYICMIKDWFDLAFLIYQIVFHSGEMEIVQVTASGDDVWQIRIPEQPGRMWNEILWLPLITALLNPKRKKMKDVLKEWIQKNKGNK